MAVPDDDCALCRSLRRRYGRFSGSAVWRTSSTVGAAEGSAAIQIEGPVGAGWRAEIKDGGAWCSFRLNDPTVLVKEGTVQSSNISNILDVYYTANTGSGERSATIEFEFFGGEPQVLVLTQVFGLFDQRSLR